MEKYWDIIRHSYSGYWDYILQELMFKNYWDNYFYGLIGISVLVWALEICFPWRKDQAIFRKDFWLDTFYMFFNFFLLNLIILIALSNTAAELFNDVLGLVGLELSSLQLFDVDDLPLALGLLIFFIVSDFVQWNTHRLLHRVPILWKFHQVHHSVKEMGFAAHLRYHWMEPVIYKSLLYIPIAIIGGYDAQQVAIVHFSALAIGHLNH
ncbi:MAG: sterol desaturase family protein, partial [Bacteroidia bacterium]|nr:sterol desaturase family protein [Bacteroidia bacterium]